MGNSTMCNSCWIIYCIAIDPYVRRENSLLIEMIGIPKPKLEASIYQWWNLVVRSTGTTRRRAWIWTRRLIGLKQEQLWAAYACCCRQTRSEGGHFPFCYSSLKFVTVTHILYNKKGNWRFTARQHLAFRVLARQQRKGWPNKRSKAATTWHLFLFLLIHHSQTLTHIYSSV